MVRTVINIKEKLISKKGLRTFLLCCQRFNPQKMAKAVPKPIRPERDLVKSRQRVKIRERKYGRGDFDLLIVKNQAKGKIAVR